MRNHKQARYSPEQLPKLNLSLAELEVNEREWRETLEREISDLECEGLEYLHSDNPLMDIGLLRQLANDVLADVDNWEGSLSALAKARAKAKAKAKKKENA